MSNTAAAPAPVVIVSEAYRKSLALEAANARQAGRLEDTTAAFWDGIVAAHGTGAKASTGPKRADIVAAVLTEIGEWSDGPQKADGKRTPFGNVVQRFGARFDAAVKRSGLKPKVESDPMVRLLKAAEAALKAGVDADVIAAAMSDLGITLPAAALAA